MNPFGPSQSTKRADILMVTLQFSSPHLATAECCLLRLRTAPVCCWCLNQSLIFRSHCHLLHPTQPENELVLTCIAVSCRSLLWFLQ